MAAAGKHPPTTFARTGWVDLQGDAICRSRPRSSPARAARRYL